MRLLNCGLINREQISGCCTEVVEERSKKCAARARWFVRFWNWCAAMVKPGATTFDLEKAAEARLNELGVKAAFKGYHGFPCVLCTSVNSEVVHGIPSPKRVLKEGDIVSVDFGVVVDGYYGDAAITVPVGAIDANAARLLKTTELSLQRGNCGGEAGRDAGRCGCGCAGSCGGRGIFRGARFCGPRHRRAYA